jgi:hypothetical protein
LGILMRRSTAMSRHRRDTHRPIPARGQYTTSPAAKADHNVPQPSQVHPSMVYPSMHRRRSPTVLRFLALQCAAVMIA